ncbi:MAG: hypothetical protein R3D63_00985 [Paracoccaceae bacterium]
MIRPLTIALVLAGACMTAPAIADCLPQGGLPQKITYNSGAIIEVLGREGDTLRYRQTIIETGKQVEMLVQDGVFTLSALRDGEGAVFEWKGALPVVADLVPGATFHAEAMLTTPGFLPPRPFVTDLAIVGMEEIEVAGCRMPALKVIVNNAEAGQSLGETVKWLHLPTLLTLRSEITARGETRVQEAVVIE